MVSLALPLLAKVSRSCACPKIRPSSVHPLSRPQYGISLTLSASNAPKLVPEVTSSASDQVDSNGRKLPGDLGGL